MFSKRTLSVLALALAALTASASASGSHVASAHEWEWSGIFDLHSDHPYTLVIATPGENVSVLVIPTDEANEHGLHEAEESAETIWHRDEDNRTVVSVGGTVGTNSLYKMHIDTGLYTSLYKLSIPSDGKYAIFLEHFPSEFETRSKLHWIKNDEGTDVETTYPTTGSTTSSTDNGNVVGVVFLATFIVSLTGIIGVFLLMPLRGMVESSSSCREQTIALTSTFASGTLVAVAVFLIIPEAHIYWQFAHPTDEPLQNFSTGASILAGVIVCYLVNMICSVLGTDSPVYNADVKPADKEGAPKTADVEMASKEDPSKAAASTDVALIRTDCSMTPSKWKSVAWNVLVGDTLHNLADGVAIAVAFKSCDSTFGWTLTGGVIAHEVVQELSDFCVLVVRGNMTMCSAAILNFLSNCSCILAGVAAASADMTRETKATILCFSAGTYLWIGLAECIPDATKVKSFGSLMLRFSCFMVGVIVIGLILIGHKHCEVSSGTTDDAAAADPHAGHGH